MLARIRRNRVSDLASSIVKWYSHSGKIWPFLSKLNTQLLMCQQLGIYPRKMKAYIHIDVFL